MDVLTHKQYKQYNYTSRYAVSPIYYHTLDDKYLVGRDKWLKDDTLYQNYTVRKGDTYVSLALRFYNNPTYFWIICSYNRVLDPFEKPKVGSTIKIPSISNIEFED